MTRRFVIVWAMSSLAYVAFPTAASAETPAPPAQTKPSACLPVVSAECGCVYSCGAGTKQESGIWLVTHAFWKDSPLRARVKPWCVAGKCTDAFHAELLCAGVCAPKPADATCHFEKDRCVSGLATP